VYTSIVVFKLWSVEQRWSAEVTLRAYSTAASQKYSLTQITRWFLPLTACVFQMHIKFTLYTYNANCNITLTVHTGSSPLVVTLFL